MDLFDSMQVSSSGLKAQRTRLNVVSSNLANIATTRTPEGGPYIKKDVVFTPDSRSFASRLDHSMRRAVQGVQVDSIQDNPRPAKMIYNPSHPDADDTGMVAMPNINLLEEISDMTSASRSYEANANAIKAAKRMALKALEIGR